jgi:ribosomal protein S18 acetylase RimI-like enzyme
MVKIIPLTYLDIDRFHQLAGGYTSPARYVVTKKEHQKKIQISLKLETLDEPYLKTWDQDVQMETHYQQILDQGLSLGAIDHGELIGLAICEKRDWNRTLWVWEFHIHPGRQGEGIGRQLMQVVFATAKRAGCRVVVCETQNTNAPAISFYRRLGFEVGGIDLSYYTNQDVEKGEVAIFMKRTIDLAGFENLSGDQKSK